MIVEVVGGAEEHPEVRVVHCDDLSGLHLALGEVTDEEADATLRQAGLGRLDGPDTAFLDVAALHAVAEERCTVADWAQRWERMLDHARRDGRVSDDGAALQVHVESAAGA